MSTQTKNILLIAGLQEQYYFAPFLNACEHADINIHICDPSRYPTESSIYAVQNDTGHIDGYIDTVHLQKGIVKKSSISLLDIDTAWYLRENYIKNLPKSLPTMETRFINNETREALQAIFSTLQCHWINKQDTIGYINSNKFYQQLIANRCGLRTP